MQRYLISTKSSIPYFEPSRPIPDSFTPPNGATSFDPPNGHRFYRAMYGPGTDNAMATGQSLLGWSCSGSDQVE